MASVTEGGENQPVDEASEGAVKRVSSIAEDDVVDGVPTTADGTILAPVEEVLSGPPPLPPGCWSVFLTATSQEAFDLDRVDGQEIRKTVPLDKLKSDIQLKGVISDVHFLKEALETTCDLQEVVFQFDDDNIYENNFVVFLTQESLDIWNERENKDKRKEEAAALAAEAERLALKNKPRGWQSLGSEEEISSFKIDFSRDLLKFSLTRKRRAFGHPYKFHDRDSHADFCECRPFKDPNFDLRKEEVDRSLQAVPDTMTATTQTLWFRHVNSGVQYLSDDVEGGLSEEIRNDEAILAFLGNVLPMVEEALLQNEVVDIVDNDFNGLGEDEGFVGNKAGSTATEFQSFTDITYSRNKAISCADWQPPRKGVIAVSCKDTRGFDERIDAGGRPSTSYILIWNFAEPIHPQFVLESPFDVLCFRFNPTRPEVLVGGTQSGQLVLWDISKEMEAARRMRKAGERRDQDDLAKKETPTIKWTCVSSIEASHRKPVSDLDWLHPANQIDHRGRPLKSESDKTEQFVTLSSDGLVLIWDLKPLEDPSKFEYMWTPVYKLTLTNIDGTGELGGAQLCLTDSSIFFCTTEEGAFAKLDWKPPEGNDLPEFVKSIARSHHGPCTALQRSPFFPDVFLTVGDWTFRIWKDGIPGPIFVSPFSTCALTSGRWSPTRPGVLLVGKADGSIDLWDLVDRSHEPSMTFTVSSAAVTCMAFTAASPYLAAGDGSGTLHILDLPHTAKKSVANEKHLVAALFDRQVKMFSYLKACLQLCSTEREGRESHAVNAASSVRVDEPSAPAAAPAVAAE